MLLQRFELVYEVARQFPKGKVISYGAIAACFGTKSSARIAGWAMNGEMIRYLILKKSFWNPIDEIDL